MVKPRITRRHHGLKGHIQWAKLSPQTIHHSESGKVDPHAYTLPCLGGAVDRALGVDIAANENLWVRKSLVN
jgi:hypothetical protein